MKELSKYILIFIITFLLMLGGISVLSSLNGKNSPPANFTSIAAPENSSYSNAPITTEDKEKSSNPLDKIWIEDEQTAYLDFVITKQCVDKNEQFVDNNCALEIKKSKKTLATFESSRDYWLNYAFFNFLGKKQKQLIVSLYSGGAHCCSDYIIYDLKPTFRVVYDSRKFDDAVGSELLPTDIDNDGVFEVRQSVMAFDYMAPGGHATSTFPPALFAYDAKKMMYEPANKRFPDYILEELNKNIAGLDDWAKENEKTYRTQTSREELAEITVRETFLYWVYAGKEKAAWEYFDENYKFKFRDKFKNEFREIFLDEAIYQTLYGSSSN